MGFPSLFIALLSMRSTFSASVAFDDIKFYFKLVFLMLIGVCLLQYRSSRRTKKVLKKLGRLEKLQMQMDGLDRSIKSVIERLDAMEKIDVLVGTQLQNLVRRSCKQDTNLEEQVEALDQNMGGLSRTIGDLHMLLAALSIDIQVSRKSTNKGTPTKRTPENDANEQVGSDAVSEGYEQEEATTKHGHLPALSDDEDVDTDADSSTCATTPIQCSEPGSGWEAVAIRIDH